MRVAIVHERFSEMGGSERVVEQLHAIWPAAPIHAAVVDERVLPPGLAGADLRPTPLQRPYRGGPGYEYLLPLLPLAIARLPLDDAELVVTSHHAFANRVRPPRGVPVVSYTHTPSRWIWDRAFRRGERGGRAGRFLLGAFAATQRRPDRAAAERLRGIVVNSRFVAERVRRWWGRSAEVVHPPVDVTFFTPDPGVQRDDFFLLAGRLVPYKRPLVAVAAAREAGVRLVVAGEGRLRPAVEAMAGPGIEVLGAIDDDSLRDLYRRCRALVFPGEEDFGIVPVEAQACGAPVLACASGGVLDSVVDGVTGSLYLGSGGDGEVDALADALRRFDTSRFEPRAARRHAVSFTPERFRARFVAAVERLLGKPVDA
jgi:glycosyltransferase involved in cell wall biosynthesis